MTSAQGRRVGRLEAAARASKGEGAMHVAFVRPGQDRAEQIAKLGTIPAGEGLMVVHFVRPADIQSPSTLQ